MLAAAVCQRVLFAESAARGQTVYDLTPGSLGAKEIDALTAEVLGLAA